MSALHVLLPPPAGHDAAFGRWLARGDRLPDVPNPREAMLRESFRFAGTEIPAAALRHHVHAEDAGIGTWVCADPVYVRSEATGARLMAWPLDVSGDEARELATALMPLFGDDGAPLVVDTPSTWCLHLADGAPRPTFTHPVAALGRDLLDCLPGGDAGRNWRQWFNEAQITLHAHPANAARAAAGKLPVNALWFWGTGRLPEPVASMLAAVATSDDVLRGLAKVAKTTCLQPSPEALEAAVGHGDVLLDLDASEGAGVSTRWLAWFQRQLRRRRFDAIELAFPAGDRFRVRHAHRLRFWRRG